MISDLLYGILICIYNDNGIYGLGLAGINLDGLESYMFLEWLIVMAGIVIILFFAVQLLLKLIKLKVKRVKK